MLDPFHFVLLPLLLTRRFKGNPHLISFYGSVILNNSPLQLGLLFEYFDGRTLADEIFHPSRMLSTHPDGVLRAKTIALHILSGLIALHNKQVRHGRLSTETIVVCLSNRWLLVGMLVAEPSVEILVSFRY